MSGDAVLVTVRQPGAGHRGGTLVLRAERQAGTSSKSIDPALATATDTMPLLRMTGDGLVAFDQVSGLAGAQLAADLATSLPEPTDGGRTYTFRLRSGIRYSNGRPVQATDFRSTFERDYALKSLVDIRRDRRRRSMPEAPEAVRPLARDRRRRRCPHRDLPPDPAGSRLSLQARAPVRLRAAGRHAAAAGRNASAARDRPLHDRDLQAGETAQVHPQSVLPRVVAGRAAGRVPRPHRHPHRPAPRTRRSATSSTARPMSRGGPSR